VKAVQRAAFSRAGFMPRKVARELMDDRIESLRELERNFDDIERGNRWFFAASRISAFIAARRARTVLDVGCGSADIARALLHDAQRRGAELQITCLDRNPQVLTIARSRTGHEPRLSFVEGDGEALPFASRAFDVVMCSLTLHHCEPPATVRMLREMRRVAGLTPLVCDLRRSVLAYAGALAFAFLSSSNRLTRHDAPLSVRRAYTPAEALDLARAASWENPSVRNEPFFRMALFDA
jgi:SAM-dependent methyltransferase